MNVKKGRNTRTEFLLPQDFRVRVHTEKNALIVEGILLLRPGTFLDLLPCGTDNGLNLSAIDKTGDVGVGYLGGGQASRTLIYF
jgi:hypothetical protein